MNQDEETSVRVSGLGEIPVRLTFGHWHFLARFRQNWVTFFCESVERKDDGINIFLVFQIYILIEDILGNVI